MTITKQTLIISYIWCTRSYKVNIISFYNVFGAYLIFT